MATIDIGKLTFTHKGDYASGTAYVLNDVVYYNGSAYIAKQNTTGNVPTNATYWNQFSAGSGGIWNSGLSLGTAGQIVKVNSGASALEFGTLSSDYVLLSTSNVTGNPGSLEVDVFSNTYSIYKIFVTSARCSTSAYLRWRFRAGGSDITNSDYLSHGHQAYWNNSSNGDGVHNELWNGDYAHLVAHQTSSGGYSLNSEITVFGTRDTTSFPSFHQMNSTYDDSNYLRHMRSMGMNRNSASTLIDGFKLYYASGTIANMQVKVYGLK